MCLNEEVFLERDHHLMVAYPGLRVTFAYVRRRTERWFPKALMSSAKSSLIYGMGQIVSHAPKEPSKAWLTVETSKQIVECKELKAMLIVTIERAELVLR